jgi:hypothetical protein
MTRDEGHRLLNRLQEGETFEYGKITAALVATGDLDGRLAAGMRSEGLDQALQTAHQGTGQTVCGRVVARHEGSHTQGAWPGWSRYLDCRNEQAAK